MNTTFETTLNTSNLDESLESLRPLLNEIGTKTNINQEYLDYFLKDLNVNGLQTFLSKIDQFEIRVYVTDPLPNQNPEVKCQITCLQTGRQFDITKFIGLIKFLVNS